MENSRTCVVSLLALLLVGVALALAGPVAGVEADHRQAGTGTRHSADGAQQLMITQTAEPTELGGEVHRRILGSINLSGLDPDRPACIKSCPAAGRSYTGRGCQKAYQCASG